jgi:hypothetical protein
VPGWLPAPLASEEDRLAAGTNVFGYTNTRLLAAADTAHVNDLA